LYRKIIVGLLFLYTLLGFLIVPYLIQSNFTQIIKKELNTNGYLGRVSINPYTFEIGLQNLLIKDNNNATLLYFKKLHLNYELSQLFSSELTIKSLMVENLKASIILYEKNKFNFTHILEKLSRNTPKENIEKKADTKSSLFFTLDTFTLKNSRIIFFDNSKSDPFSLETKAFDFELQNFSTKPNTEATLKTNIDLKDNRNQLFSFKNIAVSVENKIVDSVQKYLIESSLDTPKSGAVNLTLDISPTPLAIESKVFIENLSLVPYKEYIKDFINLDIQNTLIGTALNFSLQEEKQKLNGDIKISKIDLNHAKTKQKLLKLESMDIKGIEYTNNNLVINKIVLDTFATKFKIAQDKTTNMDNIVKKSEINTTKTNMDNIVKKSEINTTKPEEKGHSSFQYYIKSLDIKNGKTEFSDYSLPLNFDTNIHNLQANINDISSKNSHTTLKLEGVVEKYGLAKIQTTTTLEDFKDKTDVSIDFENLDVRSYSPYSGKFIGQKIQDGRLWLELNYQIDQGQLSSTNNIKLKNLTLGEDVNSSEAMNLPIGLAIALLEDSDGLIEVDVPISGDMNNPQFELSGVIWKTLGNVITNIVTAPFRFLGSLLGLDSNELGTVEYRKRNS